MAAPVFLCLKRVLASNYVSPGNFGVGLVRRDCLQDHLKLELRDVLLIPNDDTSSILSSRTRYHVDLLP
jgi:hypothetical protein